MRPKSGLRHYAESPSIAAGAKITVAVAAVTGVAIQTVFAGSHGGLLIWMSFYTIHSNLIVAAVFLLSATRTLMGLPPWNALALVERSARLWIYLTGIVFYLLLSSFWHPPGIEGVANVLVHSAVPLGVFASWLLFEQKGGYRLRELWLWVFYPLFYAGASLVRGAFDGFYPYPFLNPVQAPPSGAGSFPRVLLWIGMITLAIIVIGLLVTAIDALLQRRERSLFPKEIDAAS